MDRAREQACVCEKERECVCVRERERERESENEEGESGARKLLVFSKLVLQSLARVPIFFCQDQFPAY